MAEFWRALRTLKALQAEQQAAMTTQLRALEVKPAPVPTLERTSARAGAAAQQDAARLEACRTPNEPDATATSNKPEPARQPQGSETRLRQAGPRRNPNAREPGQSLHEAAALWRPNECMVRPRSASAEWLAMGSA